MQQETTPQIQELDPDAGPWLLTIPQVARRFGVGRHCVEQWVAHGKIRAIRFSERRVRVSLEEVTRITREGLR